MKTKEKETGMIEVLARSMDRSTVRVIKVPRIIYEIPFKKSEELIIPKGFEIFSCPFTGGYCKPLCAALLRNTPTKGKVSCAAMGTNLELGKLKAR